RGNECQAVFHDSILRCPIPVLQLTTHEMLGCNWMRFLSCSSRRPTSTLVHAIVALAMILCIMPLCCCGEVVDGCCFPAWWRSWSLSCPAVFAASRLRAASAAKLFPTCHNCRVAPNLTQQAQGLESR